MSFKFIIVSMLALSSFLSYGKEPSIVHAVRFWPAPNALRLVFEFKGSLNYKVNIINSKKILFTCVGAKSTIPSNVNINAQLLQNIKIITNNKDMTIALDFCEEVIVKHFILAPNERYGSRLVIDLDSKEKADIVALFIKEAQQVSVPSHHKYIVAIDAGHGGEDPGAIGPRGTYEKNIVLQVAQLLSQEIYNNHHNVTPILIRNSDYYVGLAERVLKARTQHADLFISLHADATANRKSCASGASVYILSSRGASSVAARLLAERENKSDLIGGLQLVKYPTIAKTLLDLSQTVSTRASTSIAHNLLSSLEQVTSLHSSRIEKAGFMVLKAPDVPSVLIELGFISHPQQELKLRNYDHQKKLAHAIALGVQKYLQTLK